MPSSYRSHVHGKQSIGDLGSKEAAFRCFISRFFDAVGAGTEPAFIDPDVDFREAMTVGRRGQEGRAL